MTIRLHHTARSTLLAFLLCAAAQAQDDAPVRPPDGVDFAGMNVVTRIVEQTFPVGNAPVVTLANRFGPIVVEAWDDAVVHIKTTVRVGAPTEEEAHRTAQLIEIAAAHESGNLEVRTVFPPAEETGTAGYAVDYEVHVPRGTSLSIENTFGDSSVSGVRGSTSIESRYGVIDMLDLAGPVRVRARGEFPLTAQRLENGGYFLLRSTQASFRDIKGALRVSNYLGSVTLHPLQVTEADIVAESGPIHLHLPEGPQPHVEARVDFGRIESEVPLNRDLWGRSELAELAAPDPAQRLAVHASFDNVYIYRPAALAQPTAPAGASQLVRDEISRTIDLNPGQAIRIDAAIGNVFLEGVADDRVTVTATRRARVQDIANARMALEGLSLRVVPEPELLRIVSVVQEDMKALGSEDYGIDLTVRCPADAKISVYADQGETHIARLTGDVIVEQGAGQLNAAQLSGTARLTNFRGPVAVNDSTASVGVTVTSGEARLERVAGNAQITIQDGRTIVDTPGGGLVVRAAGGDVRVVALEGVHGDYDIRVDDGDLSLVAPATASAAFTMNATGGAVQSAFPVTGTMDRGQHQFKGTLNEGQYRVLLQTIRGDIRVD